MFNHSRSEVPAGKVSRTLSENFIGTNQRPDWISTYGNVSSTETHSISDGRGEFEVQISNGEGGIKFPSVDTTAFREIRIGCAMRLQVSGGQDSLSAGFSTAPDSLQTAQATAMTTQAARESAATVRYKSDGSHAESDAYYDLMRGPQIIELRLQAHRQEFTVAMGSGDDIVFTESDEPYQFESAADPFISVSNTSEGTTNLWLSKVWFELYHN